LPLGRVGLQDRAHHKTNQLSGGEQQRVAIARALLNNPTLILADEPTGNLDSTTSSEVMNIFKTLNEEKGMTIIMVTHEPDIAAWARARIYLKDGLIVREERS
jgi:putative ABC transport system ATP-binding protein